MKKIIYQDSYNYTESQGFISIKQQQNSVLADSKECEVVYPEERMKLAWEGQVITAESEKTLIDFADISYKNITPYINPEFYEFWQKAGFNAWMELTGQNSGIIFFTSPIALDESNPESSLFYLKADFSLQPNMQTAKMDVIINSIVQEDGYGNNTGLPTSVLCDLAEPVIHDIFSEYINNMLNGGISLSKLQKEGGMRGNVKMGFGNTSMVPDDASYEDDLYRYDYKEGPMGIVPPKVMFQKNLEKMTECESVGYENAFKLDIDAPSEATEEAIINFENYVHAKFTPCGDWLDFYNLWSRNEIKFEISQTSPVSASLNMRWYGPDYNFEEETGERLDVSADSDIETDSETGDACIVVFETAFNPEYPSTVLDDQHITGPLIREFIESFSSNIPLWKSIFTPIQE